MVILKIAGRKYSQLKNILDEFVQLYDLTVNWKLVGSRLG